MPFTAAGLSRDYCGRRVFLPACEDARPWRDAQPVCAVAIASTLLKPVSMWSCRLPIKDNIDLPC